MTSGANTFLFDDPDLIQVAPQAVLLPGFASLHGRLLLSAVDAIAAISPFRRMETRRGFKMSVAMTNCGTYGWVSDRRGYRYQQTDPVTGTAWPTMPAIFFEVAQSAAAKAGFSGFSPDACLINRYEIGAKMSLHQDKDEKDMNAPIVSISLGLPAVFQFGGMERSDPVRKITLAHGDVAVWGGASRLAYHGILPLKAGFHDLLGTHRINLTFRRAV